MALREETYLELLRLTDEERVEVATRLLDSIAEPRAGFGNAGAEAAWRAEVRRRLADLDSGFDRTSPAEEALERVRRSIAP